MTTLWSSANLRHIPIERWSRENVEKVSGVSRSRSARVQRGPMVLVIECALGVVDFPGLADLKGVEQGGTAGRGAVDRQGPTQGAVIAPRLARGRAQGPQQGESGVEAGEAAGR